jgi:DNA-binding MarR family transcriptional regulator
MKIEREGAFLISKMHQIAGRIFARKLREYKINNFSPAQGRIMFVLWQKDNIPIQELARQTQLKKSTLTSMLDRLEDAGHIKRVPSKNDRRKIHIRLTEKDKELHGLYEKISIEVAHLFYHGFSTDEIDIFEGYLKRILTNLEKIEADMDQAS